MVSQYVWIGITVAVFAAGIAIGYGIFLGTSQQIPNQQQMFGQMMQNPQMMNQWNQQMMNDQTGRQQMMMSMMQNQQFMQNMMNEPDFQSQMIQQMNQNHDFMQSMFMQMMDDPEIRGQMIGHMLQNQEFMEQFQQNMGNQTSSAGMGMNQTGEAVMKSPVTMTTGDGKIDVELSWDPETISIDEQPTAFTFEFLDADTGQRLRDVTYAVHMMLDGEDFGHGHNETAADGISTMEQEFTSTGTLAMVVEIQKVGNTDINQLAQFSVAVTPELPAAAIALAAGIAAMIGLSIMRARSRI